MIRKLMILLLSASFICMTGCWNYRELDTMDILAGIAIDRGAGGNGYHLTFEILGVSETGGDTGPTMKSLIAESDGVTIFDAIRNFLKRSGKKLYFGHCKTVVISDELAREGIVPDLDFIIRDPEPRVTINIFISKEKSAKEILETKGINNPITSFALGKINENDSRYLSKSVYVQLFQATNMLGGDGISLTLPALHTVYNQDEKTAEIAGTAVFMKDRLLGYIGSDESKYLLMIKNKANGGILPVNMESEAADVALEIMKCNTKVTPVLTGTKPKFKIEVKIRAFLDEMQTKTDYITEDGLKEVEEKSAQIIETNIRQLVEKVQLEFNSDIFGFGSTINKADPDYWEKIKPQWDFLFPFVDVEVSAKVQIKNTSNTKSKIKVGG